LWCAEGLSSYLASERAKIIDEIARRIVDTGFGDLAVIALEGYQPVMGLMGPMSYISFWPWIQALALKWPEFHSLGELMAADPIGTTREIVDNIREKTVKRVDHRKDEEERKNRPKDEVSFFSLVTHFIRSIFQR